MVKRIALLSVGLLSVAGLMVVGAAGAAPAPPEVPDSIQVEFSRQFESAGGYVGPAEITLGDELRDGKWQWPMYMQNFSSVTVRNPKITVDSDYKPSLFTWGDTTVKRFPATYKAKTLKPGEGLNTGLLSASPDSPGASLALGFDSARVVDVTDFPAGGGPQVLTVSVTPGARFAGGSDDQCFDIVVESALAGVTAGVPTLPPENGWYEAGSGDPSVMNLYLCGSLTVGDTYTFTIPLMIPASPNGVEFVPYVGIYGNVEIRGTAGPTSSVTIQDPVAPVSGTFSLASPVFWDTQFTETYGIGYGYLLVIH